MKSTAFPALFLVLMARAAAAQHTVPVSEEPRHHVRFANAYVRVYDVVVPPGDTTLFHVHAIDYTYVSIGAANLVAQALGAAPGPLVLADGEARFTKGPITHRVWNVGATAFHNLTIELLHRDSAVVQPPAMLPGDSLLLDNERVRVTRRAVAPGQLTWTSDAIHSLVVLVSGGQVQSGSGGDDTKPTDVKPGTYFWTDTAASPPKNAGSQPIVVVTFFVK